MKREIKFRAWDGKRIIPNVGIHPYICMKHWYEEKDSAMFIPKDSDGNQTILSSYEHLMQFTGLKDENGVEIYEGDIIQYMFADDYICNYTINFDVEFAFFYAFPHTEDDDECHSHLWEFAKVIGNIYENPELLK